MYLTVLKTAVVEALRATFDSGYPNLDFRLNSENISIEYPVAQSNYPGIWVQYEDAPDSLHIAGIGHEETSVDGSGNVTGRYTRWRFQGTVTLTCTALSSQERDRLYDEIVRVFVSAKYNDSLSEFRNLIEQNDLVAINANFDDLRPFGDNAAPGTPWGTDEAIYEKSISFDTIGEFISDVFTGSMLPLSKVEFIDYVDGTTPPKFPDEPGSTTAPPTPGDWNRTQWT